MNRATHPPLWQAQSRSNARRASSGGLGEAAQAIAAQVAGAIVVHSENSSPRDALVFVGESLAFATMCGIVACYLAWTSGLLARDIGSNRFFDEHAWSEPAVYQSIPEGLDKHLQHLAAAPYDPGLCLAFGVEPPSSESMGEFVWWKDGYLTYALGVSIPNAFTAWR